jgi:hypothetical protein
MRKILALTTVALLALTFAIAALGCGKKEEAAPASMEQTTAPADTAAAMAMDSTGATKDTTQAAH